MRRIGLLGGTFNPVHIGHLILAQECWHQLDLDKVIFVPAFIPPHKEVARNIVPSDRLNMVRLALEGDDRFEISSYEIDKQEISYSIQTIDCFLERYNGDADLFFITGADSLAGLSTWKEIDSVLEKTTFIVAARPGFEGTSPYDQKIRRIEIPDIEISSTMIRERITEKKPIDFLIPGKVLSYIRNKGLYK